MQRRHFFCIKGKIKKGRTKMIELKMTYKDSNGIVRTCSVYHNSDGNLHLSIDDVFAGRCGSIVLPRPSIAEQGIIALSEIIKVIKVVS
jgi:hypothetical protein